MPFMILVLVQSYKGFELCFGPCSSSGGCKGILTVLNCGLTVTKVKVMKEICFLSKAAPGLTFTVWMTNCLLWETSLRLRLCVKHTPCPSGPITLPSQLIWSLSWSLRCSPFASTTLHGPQSESGPFSKSFQHPLSLLCLPPGFYFYHSAHAPSLTRVCNFQPQRHPERCGLIFLCLLPSTCEALREKKCQGTAKVDFDPSCVFVSIDLQTRRCHLQ